MDIKIFERHIQGSVKGSRLLCLLFTFFLFMTACNQSHKSGTDATASFTEFLQQFPAFTAPYTWDQDSLARAPHDSGKLVYKTGATFIPDSVWYPQGKKSQPAQLYAVGKNHYNKLELLLVRIKYGATDKINLLIYDQKDTLVAVQPLMERNPSSRESSSFEFDRKYLLHLNEQKNLSTGEVIKREDVYSINTDGTLSLIMTNTNQPSNPNSYYNPIDTLPQQHHYSGDYFSGKADIVSIRDGDTPGTFRFFIHLNKNKGDCTGEIDGIGNMEQSASGIFKEDDGPCAIRFHFSANRVRIEEVGGCGAYRGISCNFSGTYTSKKKAKSGK